MPQAYRIDDAMPPSVAPKRMTWAVSVPRAAHPPMFDGQFHAEDWPGGLVRLDREPSRWPATGAPVYAYLAYDDRFLYVAVNVAMFEASKLRTGTAWGKDDGAEFCIAGRTPDGKPVTFVIRGFAGGTVQSVTDAGAPPRPPNCWAKACGSSPSPTERLWVVGEDSGLFLRMPWA